MKTLILLSFCAASASLMACSSTSDDTVAMPSQSLQAPQSDTSSTPATPQSSDVPPPVLPESSTAPPASGQPPPANPDAPLP